MKNYLLRWCYHFHNKPSVRGQWSPAAPEGAASLISREGLKCAVIEAKDFRTREVFPLFECDGQDFIIFQWIASRTVQGLPSVMGASKIEGLRIIARNQYIEAYTNGEVEIKEIEIPNESFQSLKR